MINIGVERGEEKEKNRVDFYTVLAFVSSENAIFHGGFFYLMKVTRTEAINNRIKM